MDIADWLRGLSLERYAETFRDNAVEVEVLPELTEADLEKLGVLLGHRKIMLRAIAALGAPAPQSMAEPPPAAVSVHTAADGSPSLTLLSPGLSRGSRGRAGRGLKLKRSGGS